MLNVVQVKRCTRFTPSARVKTPNAPRATRLPWLSLATLRGLTQRSLTALPLPGYDLQIQSSYQYLDMKSQGFDLKSNACIPAAGAPPSISPQTMPCCINPPVIKGDNQPSSGPAPPAKKVVPRYVERIVSQATRFCKLVEDREHFWPLVKGRTTYDLHSSAVISREQVEGLDSIQLHRNLPEGGPRYPRGISP